VAGDPKGGGMAAARFRDFLRRVHRYLELSLLTHWPFLVYSLAVTFFNAGYFVPYVHLVAHGRQAGFSEYRAAFIMSATGGADIAGRLTAGWLTDLGCARLLHMLTVWTGLTGVFIVLMPLGSLAGSYWLLLALGMCYGFCAGALTSLVFTAVPEIVGMGRMVGALGLLQLLESVGGLLGAPLSGETVEAGGGVSDGGRRGGGVYRWRDRLYRLGQGWANYGPRATCGPLRCLMRPVGHLH